MSDRPDVVVIGAGVFGAWAAYLLRRTGRSVLLLDAFGVGNTRSSSGGESRILRLGYGSDVTYTRLAHRSRELWMELCRGVSEVLFHRTGVLWMAHGADAHVEGTAEALAALGVPCQRLSRPDLSRRYPQIAFESVDWGLVEPEAGVLMARRAVRRLVNEVERLGGSVRREAVEPPPIDGALVALRTAAGTSVSAGTYVFACGPWLPRLFPRLLGTRIRPTRQEVFFFGVPPGDRRFDSPDMPAWIDFGSEVYGLPDVEARGFKVGLDRHGRHIDPGLDDRIPRPEQLDEVRGFLRRRFPDLGDAPLLEARVCQYANTSSGDFLVDRHPAVPNVWLVGGGSGHGFKQGPGVAEYLVSQLDASAPPRATVHPRGQAHHPPPNRPLNVLARLPRARPPPLQRLVASAAWPLSIGVRRLQRSPIRRSRD